MGISQTFTKIDFLFHKALTRVMSLKFYIEAQLFTFIEYSLKS